MNILQKLMFNFYYFQKPPWDTGVSPPELMEYIHTHPPGTALDLGCGSGTNVITLAKHGWKATGVDFAYRAIAVAKRKIRQEKVEVQLVAGDVTDLTMLRNPFDFILDIGCFHLLENENIQKYVKNILRLIKPGGTYLMWGFFSSQESFQRLTDGHIKELNNFLNLISRKDNVEPDCLPSAWFTFKR